MEHAEAVKLIKDYGFAVLKHQNNWLGEAYEALLRALLATPAPLSDEPVAIYQIRASRFTPDWTDVSATDARFYDYADDERRIVYAAPPATPSDKQVTKITNAMLDAAVAAFKDRPEYSVRESMRAAIAASLAQSAEQDRIDAERIRQAKLEAYESVLALSDTHITNDRLLNAVQAAIDLLKGASK